MNTRANLRGEIEGASRNRHLLQRVVVGGLLALVGLAADQPARAAQSAPTSITASDGTYTSHIRISWNVPSGATEYKVYRYGSSASGSALAVSGWQSATSFNDTSASPGTCWYYWVKARNAAGEESGLSTWYDCGWRKLSAPTNLTATDGTNEYGVNIGWSGSWGASDYRVWRGTSNEASKATALYVWINAVSYLDTSVTPGQTYYYWVAAATDNLGSHSTGLSNGDSGWQELQEPTDVQARGECHGIVVSWLGWSGSTHYRVWRGTANNHLFDTAVSDWITSTSFKDYSADPDRTYYYWVKAAVSSSGSHRSDFSASAAGSYEETPTPTGVVASDDLTDMVRISWDDVGAYYFNVYRNTVNDPASAELLHETWFAYLEYDDTTAEVNVNYYYWVQAAASSDGECGGDFSAVAKGSRIYDP